MFLEELKDHIKVKQTRRKKSSPHLVGKKRVRFSNEEQSSKREPTFKSKLEYMSFQSAEVVEKVYSLDEAIQQIHYELEAVCKEIALTSGEYRTARSI